MGTKTTHAVNEDTRPRAPVSRTRLCILAKTSNLWIVDGRSSTSAWKRGRRVTCWCHDVSVMWRLALVSRRSAELQFAASSSAHRLLLLLFLWRLLLLLLLLLKPHQAHSKRRPLPTPSRLRVRVDSSDSLYVSGGKVKTAHGFRRHFLPEQELTVKSDPDNNPDLENYIYYTCRITWQWHWTSRRHMSTKHIQDCWCNIFYKKVNCYKNLPTVLAANGLTSCQTGA